MVLCLANPLGRMGPCPALGLVGWAAVVVVSVSALGLVLVARLVSCPMGREHSGPTGYSRRGGWTVDFGLGLSPETPVRQLLVVRLAPAH